MIVNSLPSDVTYFTSAQANMPSMMGGSNGDMLKVLDACLINGGADISVLTITENPDNVILVFQNGHNCLEGQVVLVSGANNPQLNGRHKVISATTTSLTLDVAGVSNELGSLVVKQAPLGWQSIFGSASPLKRAYRSTDINSSKRVIYLDMDYSVPSLYHATSPARRAVISVCTDMQTIGVQIGSLTDAINNFASNPNGSLFWYQKKDRNNTVAVPNTITQWKIIGNGKFFYFIIGWCCYGSVFDSTNYADVFGFGEFVKLSESSQDSTFLMAANLNNDVSTTFSIGWLGASMGQAAKSTYAYSYSDNTFQKNKISPMVSPNASAYFVSGSGDIPYPNGYGDALFASSCRLFDNNKNVIGLMPSMLYIENKTNGNYDSQVIDGVFVAQVQGSESTIPNAGNIGFYTGV